MKVSNEKDVDVLKHAGECEDAKYLVTLVKVEPYISWWEYNDFEEQDVGSFF